MKSLLFIFIILCVSYAVYSDTDINSILNKGNIFLSSLGVCEKDAVYEEEIYRLKKDMWKERVFSCSVLIIECAVCVIATYLLTNGDR